MDYLIVFLGGMVTMLVIAVVMGKFGKLAAIQQLRKELNLPDGDKPVSNPYARGETARAEYKEARARSMWGPREHPPLPKGGSGTTPPTGDPHPNSGDK